MLLGNIGFKGIAVKERFDCFRGTTKERVAKKYGVLGVNVYALRGHDGAAQS
jgi:hypothetical protein